MDFITSLLFSGWLLAFLFSGSGLQSPVEVNFSQPETPEMVTLGAVGDINMGRQTGQEILKGNIDYPFEFIKTELQAFDITFGNLESQLRETGGVTQNPDNIFIFSGPKEGAQSLKNAGFDVVSTANNHMWDYGHNGLTQTLDALEEQGIIYTGASKERNKIPELKTIERNQQTIGFLSATDLLNGFERTEAPEYVTMTSHPDLMDKIKQSAEQVDWLLVSLHMGVEYQTTPAQSKINLSRQMIDNGANIVLGHHPHVRQPIEKYNDGLIAHSLGNFAFWQPFSEETKTGTLLKLELNPDSTFEYQAIDIEAGWQPRLKDTEL